jgi:hypothetical protein
MRGFKTKLTCFVLFVLASIPMSLLLGVCLPLAAYIWSDGTVKHVEFFFLGGFVFSTVMAIYTFFPLYETCFYLDTARAASRSWDPDDLEPVGRRRSGIDPATGLLLAGGVGALGGMGLEDLNPATGLPLVAGIGSPDIGGNSYGESFGHSLGESYGESFSDSATDFSDHSMGEHWHV